MRFIQKITKEYFYLMHYHCVYNFYLQVEDMMWKTEPVTVNFSRPGQRTLWCHTPQVIHSGLLRKLEPSYTSKYFS